MIYCFFFSLSLTRSQLIFSIHIEAQRHIALHPMTNFIFHSADESQFLNNANIILGVLVYKWNVLTIKVCLDWFCVQKLNMNCDGIHGLLDDAMFDLNIFPKQYSKRVA